ncbi:hypothetical protein LTR85_004006 [Meristemomyces frigidus]|nr:hypothetical protein LTR85_004006 [Meristemomyces frigidus]
MARINIPLDALTSRLNLSGRFDSVRSQSIANRFANLKGVGEFLDLKRLSKPRDMGDMQQRVNYNLSYFSSNYAVVFVMLSIYSLLTNLLLLFVIILVVGGMFGISKLGGRDLDVGFARATPSQLYTAMLVIAVPLGIWASPITTVLWLVGASAVTILGHASFMDRPIEANFSEEAADDWELRQQAGRHGDPRFQELDSEEEDGMGQGVLLDPNGYSLRDAQRQRGAFAGDELHFDGYDIGQDRQRRRQVYDYADGYDSEEEAYRRRGAAYQVAVRDKEEALLQSAVERIARARAKGKTNVNLSPEEMEALERRRGQPPEPYVPPTQALASPPATPAKIPKGKAGSRSSSSTSLASQKTRKRGNTNSLFSGQSSPSPAKSNSKAKVERNPSAEQALPYPSGSGPPGIMVPGPNGVPVFAPIVNYAPPSPELARAQPGGTRTRSRSTSKHSRRESTPPERADPYAQYPPRYYHPSGGVRPESSGSNRSMPDDIDWYPPPARNRSASNAQYAGYRPGPDDYDVSHLPAAQGRRNVSGPADVRYSSLRRAPPSSSPLAPRPTAQHAASDPAVSGRKVSSLGQELERTSSSSSDDQGVQVNIVPDAGGGYSINRAPAGPAAATGNEGRRRKGGRR